MTLPDILKRLNDICLERGIPVYKPDEKSDNLCHFRFGDGGLIAIYTTKDGLNLRYKLGKMQELGKSLLEDVFTNQNGEIEHISGTCAMYEGILDKYDTVENFKDDLCNCIIQSGAKIEPKTLNPYAVFSGDIIRGHEKITVHIYRTKVLLQGKNYFLWDEVCSWIERKLEAPVNEILVRVTGDRDIFEKITVSKGTNVINEAEAILRSRLKQAYEYLLEHDQKFLKSAVCLILYGNELPEYSGIVTSAFKGFEGYFRKAIAEKIGSRIPEVMNRVYNPRDNFSWLFDSDHITDSHYLKAKYTDPANISCDRAFERLYLIYKDRRNPYAHSTGVATFD